MRNKFKVWEDMSYSKLGVVFLKKTCITEFHKKKINLSQIIKLNPSLFIYTTKSRSFLHLDIA